MAVTYRRATVADEDSIHALYDERGYTRGIQPKDMIWVAEAKEGVIGVCRVAPELGTFVFRGLFIVERCRGLGIGTWLAKTALVAANVKECYCLPEPHLVAFYADLGFGEVAADAGPSFLATRLQKYRAEGSNVVLMRRSLI